MNTTAFNGHGLSVGIQRSRDSFAKLVAGKVAALADNAGTGGTRRFDTHKGVGLDVLKTLGDMLLATLSSGTIVSQKGIQLDTDHIGRDGSTVATALAIALDSATLVCSTMTVLSTQGSTRAAAKEKEKKRRAKEMAFLKFMIVVVLVVLLCFNV